MAPLCKKHKVTDFVYLVNAWENKNSFYYSEAHIIEGDDEKIRGVIKSNESISKFRQATNDLSGVYGLYVIDLDTGLSYGVNENEIFQAASLIKLPVMVAMYIEEESSSLSLSKKYKLKNEDKVGGAGSLYAKPESHEITYKNLIRLMAKQSDNTAFNICRNFLGDEKVQDAINNIGLTRSNLVNNETTPKDIGIFFEELWNGNLINEMNKNELLGFLTDTIYEEWLAAGIPDDIQVAHKYGRETHVVNDAGIVFADKPFVVVIMSKGVVEREADNIFPELARMVWEIHDRN